MAEYHIRAFEDRDHEAIHLQLLAVFLVAYVVSASFLFSCGVVATFWVTGWMRMKGVWAEYTQAALVRDMLDIRKTYLEPKDCCLWVATSGEEVVGMVAAVHPEDPSQWGKALELKRMSVAKGHRGRGLSKALTRTVICFAQERGYKGVVLSTSMLQYAAQRVYEGMGFRKVKAESPSLLAKLLQFHMYYYHYEIAGSH
uniref:Uncharacterized protein n=1 Tax=Sphaerodactylus townsendi TaxID=933632 RepID=A0ACB8E9D7_9SAUR